MSASRATFITDLGPNLEVRGERERFVLERYGVWVWDEAKCKHQVADSGSDLAALKRKYDVPDDRVIDLVRR